jgi:hypothetical protein
MVSFVLAIQVEAPVCIEVARYLERAQLQNGFRSGNRPAGAAAIQAIADEVTASSLDNTACDGEAMGQGVAIAHVVAALANVPSTLVDGGAFLDLAERRAASYSSGDLAWIAPVEEPSRVVGDPVPCFVRAGLVETIRRFPQVLHRMDEVADDGNLHPVASCGGLDGPELLERKRPVTGILTRRASPTKDRRHSEGGSDGNASRMGRASRTVGEERAERGGVRRAGADQCQATDLVAVEPALVVGDGEGGARAGAVSPGACGRAVGPGDDLGRSGGDRAAQWAYRPCRDGL